MWLYLYVSTINKCKIENISTNIQFHAILLIHFYSVCMIRLYGMHFEYICCCCCCRCCFLNALSASSCTEYELNLIRKPHTTTDTAFFHFFFLFLLFYTLLCFFVNIFRLYSGYGAHIFHSIFFVPFLK